MKGPGAPPTRPSRWRRLARVLGFLARELGPFRASLALALLALFLQRAATLTLPALTKLVVDDVLGQRRAELLPPIALLLFASAVVQAGAGLAMSRILVRTSEELVAKLRRDVHAHALKLPVAFFDETRAGKLAHQLLHESAEIEAFAGPFLLETAGALMTALLALIVLVYLNAGLTLFVCIIALLLLVASAANLRHAFTHAATQNRVEAELSGHLAESLSAIRVVKTFRAEPREREIFGRGIARLFDLALRGSRASMRLSAISTTLLGGATALIVYLAASRVLSNAMSLGEMLTFLACLAYLIGPLLQLATMTPGILRAGSAMERTMLLLSLAPEGSGGGRELSSIHGDIAFEAVSFRYGDTPVLRDIDFSAKPSEVTAIVGPSGAGKSTILALLAGFYAPTVGRILIDGHDLASLTPSAYREHLALVPQEPVLFDGSIADNVALARPDASEAEIREACEVAGVHAFVSELPEGYETRVGERGANLSAGQKQRVAIARAWLAKGPLLLFDEPTSALDAESEALLEPLLTAREGKTTVVVSHRLSTIRRADQVLVLDEGRIVERGTHASLMAARGRYFRMFGEEADVARASVRAS